MKIKVPTTELMKPGEILHTHVGEVLQAFVITKILSSTTVLAKPAVCDCQKAGKRHGSVQ